MRRLLIPAALLALGTFPARAQDAATFRAGPSFVSYKVGDATTSQMVLPMVAVIPVSSRFTIDIATAFATTQFSQSTGTSSISGLTDTQLRANYALNGDNLVLTFGFNIPTGKSAITSDQLLAAQAIGIDFFTFPVPAYGTGLAGTVGLAYAAQAGDWEIGAGGSFRKATSFEPASGSSAKYTPGDEYRLRFGAARAVGEGRFSLGVIFSAFGTPTYDTTTISTGARAIVQAVYSHPVGSNELFLTLWNLYTGSGKLLAGAAEASNILNVGIAYGIHQGNLTWEPNVEGRIISQGSATGKLVFPGLRVRIPAANWTIYPGASAAFGSVVGQSVSGVRATLGIQYVP